MEEGRAFEERPAIKAEHSEHGAGSTLVWGPEIGTESPVFGARSGGDGNYEVRRQRSERVQLDVDLGWAARLITVDQPRMRGAFPKKTKAHQGVVRWGGEWTENRRSVVKRGAWGS